jgi:hypothetical protein
MQSFSRLRYALPFVFRNALALEVLEQASQEQELQQLQQAQQLSLCGCVCACASFIHALVQQLQQLQQAQELSFCGCVCIIYICISSAVAAVAAGAGVEPLRARQ